MPVEISSPVCRTLSTPLPAEPRTCCAWLARVWNRICEIFASLCCCRKPATLSQRQVTLILGPDAPPAPSQAERVILAFCKKLRALSPEKAGAEFHNVGAALFFSLSMKNKFFFLKELPKSGAQEPYLRELSAEMQNLMRLALQVVMPLELDCGQSEAQNCLQSILFNLLVLKKVEIDTAQFKDCPVVDQLRIIYHLNRIFYHTELRLDIDNDRCIQQLLDLLPKTIREDIASKVKDPDRRTYELCSALIKDYIKPAANPESAPHLFFLLHDGDPSASGALETFARLTAEVQRPILERMQPEMVAQYLQVASAELQKDIFLRRYEVGTPKALDTFKKLSQEGQHEILQAWPKAHENSIKPYLSDTLRETIEDLRTRTSGGASFLSYVKVALTTLPS